MAQILGKWIKDRSITSSKIDNNDTYTIKGLLVDPSIRAGSVSIGATTALDALHIKRSGSSAGIRMDSSRSYRIFSDVLGNFNIADSLFGSRIMIDASGKVEFKSLVQTDQSVSMLAPLSLDQLGDSPLLNVTQRYSLSTAPMVLLDNTSSTGKSFSVLQNSPNGGPHYEVFSITPSGYKVAITNPDQTTSLYIHNTAARSKGIVIDMDSNSQTDGITVSGPTTGIRSSGSSQDFHGEGVSEFGSLIIRNDATFSKIDIDAEFPVLNINGYNTSAFYAALNLQGSNDPTIGILTTTLDQDVLGQISFSGVNTGLFRSQGAYIIGRQIGDADPFNIRGQLEFKLSNGGASPYGIFSIDGTKVSMTQSINSYVATDTPSDPLLTMSSGLYSPNTVFQVDASGQAGFGTAVSTNPNVMLNIQNTELPAEIKLTSVVGFSGSFWRFAAGDISDHDLMIEELGGPSKIYINGASNATPGNLTIGIQTTEPQAGIDMTSAFDFPLFNGHRPTDTSSDILLTLNSGSVAKTVFQVDAMGRTSLGASIGSENLLVYSDDTSIFRIQSGSAPIRGFWDFAAGAVSTYDLLISGRYGSSMTLVPVPGAMKLGLQTTTPQAVIDSTGFTGLPLYKSYHSSTDSDEFIFEIDAGSSPLPVFRVTAAGHTFIGNTFNSDYQLGIVNDSTVQAYLTRTAGATSNWSIKVGPYSGKDLVFQEGNGAKISFQGDSPGNTRMGVATVSPQAAVDATSVSTIPVFQGYNPSNDPDNFIFTLNAGSSPLPVFRVTAAGHTFIGNTFNSDYQLGIVNDSTVQAYLTRTAGATSNWSIKAGAHNSQDLSFEESNGGRFYLQGGTSALKVGIGTTTVPGSGTQLRVSGDTTVTGGIAVGGGSGNQLNVSGDATVTGGVNIGTLMTTQGARFCWNGQDSGTVNVSPSSFFWRMANGTGLNLPTTTSCPGQMFIFKCTSGSSTVTPQAGEKIGGVLGAKTLTTGQALIILSDAGSANNWEQIFFG